MNPELSPTSSVELSQDEVDPDLLALPDPPKTGLRITVAALLFAALVSLVMVFALRRDVAYAFAPAAPSDLGDLRTAEGQSLAAVENHEVRANAMLGAAGGILYERPFTDDTFRALPVAGRDDVWVEVRVPRGKENGRWEPPRSFTGRLVRFDAAGPRHRGLASAVEAATHRPVASDAWLIVDREAPQRARWSVALAALFLAFAAWNIAVLVKLTRKVR